MARKLKILFTSSEVYPYAKTGGLADISGALPKALQQLGHDVRVLMPKYKSVVEAPQGFEPLHREVDVPLAGRSLKGFLFQGRLDSEVPIYFMENDGYFYRDQLYGSASRDYPDNAERFIFFCRAILETCRTLGFRPDIIHCNDWQTGLVPVYLKTVYAGDPWFAGTRTIFSVHNLGYQGNFKRSDLFLAGLPSSLFTPEGVEFYGHFSFLKSALMFADLLTTVSPNYSREIQTPEYGFGMEGVLRHRAADLHGVLNGVDYEEWDPARDPWIARPYGPDRLQGKKECQDRLRNLFSLHPHPRTPIVSMVTRLSDQKGIDLVCEAVEPVLERGSAFVLLGSGEVRYENFFHRLARRYPGQAGAHIGFDEGLAHQILAGSDLLLMPSRYEPCGLTQLYGLKYGTVPLVRAVGGLQDTVKAFNSRTRTGTGFKFRKYAFRDLLREIEKALSIYRKEALWRRLVRNGMTQDYSWHKAAAKYHRLYLKALRR